MRGMKRLLLLCCLLSLTGVVCPNGSEFHIDGLPAEVKEGDVLPVLTVPDAVEQVTLSLKDAAAEANSTRPFDLPDQALLGTRTQLLDAPGTATFDDLIIPSTGTYRLLAKVSDGSLGWGTSKDILVTTRNFAEVTCQEDGSIIAATSTQTPLPTIIGEGSCRLTKGGGNPVPANFGTARCEFSGVSASCIAPMGNCFDRGPGTRIAPGTTVNASWSGGTVTEGTAMATRPDAVTAPQPPASHSRGLALRLPFTGADAGVGTVHLTVVQQIDSTVAIDCLVPVTAGMVEAPASLLGVLQPGVANVLLRVEGRRRAPSRDFDTTLVVPGPTITGYVDAVPLTLE